MKISKNSKPKKTRENEMNKHENNLEFLNIMEKIPQN